MTNAASKPSFPGPAARHTPAPTVDGVTMVSVYRRMKPAIPLATLASAIVFLSSVAASSNRGDPTRLPVWISRRRRRTTTPSSGGGPLAAGAVLDLRGGAKAALTSRRKRKQGPDDPYGLLARAILRRYSETDCDDQSSSTLDPAAVASALRRLSSAQGALKKLDGAAHEAYQRTHASPAAMSVSGRALRSAARAGCAADALFAAELCELIERPDLVSPDHAIGDDGTLAPSTGREVLFNSTLPARGRQPALSILVLFERSYAGGAGLDHGGIDLLTSSTPGSGPTPQSSSSSRSPRGRVLVVLRDSHSSDLPATVSCLDAPPEAIALSAGLVANEAASVCGALWRSAGRVLDAIGPALFAVGGGGTDDHGNTTTMQEAEAAGASAESGESNLPVFAVHFVGKSLAGGVAALAAAILDGSLNMPLKDNAKRRKGGAPGRNRRGVQRESSAKEKKADDSAAGDDNDAKEKDRAKPSTWHGYGRGRSSAVALGPPPCLSSNVKAAFVTSIIHGDDVVCRTSRASLDRLCKRTRKAMKGGLLGKRVGWMSDAVSLTVSSLRSHAHGSEGEEGKLAVPGKVYLVRPRRLGGASSMHEVGAATGGREALRAAVLWQLNDVLLSRSLWAHHGLGSYINGLDRVQLRGFSDEQDGEEMY